VRYVDSRDARAAMMESVAADERAAGRRPYVIPIGASTPLGAAAFVFAVAELLEQLPAPDVIVHASSSGGTQAGLIAGCVLAGVKTRVIGISADETSASLSRIVRDILAGLAPLGGLDESKLTSAAIEVDDGFVGGGYGVPTDESRAAIELLARTEALFLDPTYTAKAMAGLLAYLRQRRFSNSATVVFWHTGGQVGLFS
jgi:1-aminocyclopropane-1-carboxylate deaminase/D-cysteine desulfhydrase-like pyridoxal-dependent ACC family enzyme